MGGWFGFIILGVLTVVPFWKLLPKYGFPAPAALIALIPFGAIVLLWVMAFNDKLTKGRG